MVCVNTNAFCCIVQASIMIIRRGSRHLQRFGSGEPLGPLAATGNAVAIVFQVETGMTEGFAELVHHSTNNKVCTISMMDILRPYTVMRMQQLR